MGYKGHLRRLLGLDFADVVVYALGLAERSSGGTGYYGCWSGVCWSLCGRRLRENAHCEYCFLGRGLVADCCGHGLGYGGLHEVRCFGFRNGGLMSCSMVLLRLNGLAVSSVQDW